MTTKERIQAEIERVNGEDLDELYEVIREFVQAKNGNEEHTHEGNDLISRLMRIQIEGPENFSVKAGLCADTEDHVQ